MNRVKRAGDLEVGDRLVQPEYGQVVSVQESFDFSNEVDIRIEYQSVMGMPMRYADFRLNKEYRCGCEEI